MLFSKIISYLDYLSKKIIFVFTLKKMDGELKNNYKEWIYYSNLKAKYSKFLRSYKKQTNSEHKYSDYIWWCWFQGEEKSPALCKKCLESVRKVFPDKNIIVITSQNISEWVALPTFIEEKHKKGYISNAHYSDLVRLNLLIKHGGIWIDSTVFCTDRPVYAENEPLFVYQSKERCNPASVASNWFISSEINNPILLLVYTMLLDYWKKHNKVYHYFIFHFFLTMASQLYSEEWNKIPFYSNLTCHIMQRELFNKYSEERLNQIKYFSGIHKLTHKYDKSTNKNGTLLEYILK